jgi:hypothetical protein
MSEQIRAEIDKNNSQIVWICGVMEIEGIDQKPMVCCNFPEQAQVLCAKINGQTISEEELDRLMKFQHELIDDRAKLRLEVEQLQQENQKLREQLKGLNYSDCQQYTNPDAEALRRMGKKE